MQVLQAVDDQFQAEGEFFFERHRQGAGNGQGGRIPVRRHARMA
jgi:hypothetical protein